MDLTYRDIVEILQIVDTSGFSKLTIEDGSFKLSISRGQDGQSMEATVGQGPVTRIVDRVKEPIATPPITEKPSNGETAPTAARTVSVGGLELSFAQPSAPAQVPETAVAVPSPMLGVFYRRPSPEAPPFVETGSKVAEGDTLCLVEAMKMFMPVQAPVAGTVVAIAAENKALVEFNQPLIWIDPEV